MVALAIAQHPLEGYLINERGGYLSLADALSDFVNNHSVQ